MKKDLTKKTFKSALFGVVSLVIIGIVLLYFSTGNFFRILKGHTAFEELLPGEISNQIVDASIKDNFGAFMEEYSKNTKTRVETSKAFYYVIWTGDDNAEDYRFMAIKVPASYEDEMEKMADNTYNYMSSEPIEFSGSIEKMSDEEYRYFKEYFMDSGYTTAEFEQYTLPYYIDVDKLTGVSAVVTIIMFAAGVLCLIAGIWKFISALTGGKVKKLYKDIEAYGYNESVVEADYQAGIEFKNSARISNLFTYYIDASSHARALLNKDIVWAYMQTTTHRTNGIKTATTYAINVFTINNKKNAIVIGVKNEKIALEMVEYLSSHMPWAVVGYHDEISRMYHGDYETFLQQKYHTFRQSNFVCVRDLPLGLYAALPKKKILGTSYGTVTIRTKAGSATHRCIDIKAADGVIYKYTCNKAERMDAVKALIK